MEPDLFDITANYHRGNPQSVEANKITNKRRSRIRIIEMLRIHDYTCDELEGMLLIPHQTCSARISELKRDGLIHKIGTRKTRSGSPAAVYQAI